MRSLRQISVLIVGALLLLDVGSAAYAADPAYPSGTFTPVQTSTYLSYNPQDDRDPYASFDIRRTNLADDATAPEDLVTEIVKGDGSAVRPLSCSGSACFVSYDRAGTFHPEIRLTDGDGHTSTYTIGPLRVVPDTTKPTVRLTSPKPRPRLRHHKKAWRVMRGVAHDSGIGLNYVKVLVLQRRHGWWWFYNGYQHTWHKGARTEWRTQLKFGPPGTDAVLNANGTWRSRPVKHLTKGRIVVRAFVTDTNYNEASRVLLARARITRR